MKLQTKFNLAIISIFSIVAVGIAALTVYEVNTLVIRLAENRVRIYMRAAWEILFSPDDTWLPIKAFLEKPLRPDKLLREIQKLLGPREQAPI